eukprot:783847-Pleurochrysis_carterae.AAC.2
MSIHWDTARTTSIYVCWTLTERMHQCSFVICLFWMECPCDERFLRANCRKLFAIFQFDLHVGNRPRGQNHQMRSVAPSRMRHGTPMFLHGELRARHI